MYSRKADINKEVTERWPRLAWLMQLVGTAVTDGTSSRRRAVTVTAADALTTMMGLGRYY